ncbi:MAG: trigger factor [Acidimicrobiia bacterium]|nr:trigger factor [Acidimicrobiia bacterium]
MESTVQALEGNRVKLSVEVTADEFEPAVEAAFRELARQVNIPGFRRGKAPRKILEARFGGPGVARQQALQDALPDFYAQAVREHEVDVIAQPEIELTDGAEEGPVSFAAVVEVRPTISVSGYDSIAVSIPRHHVVDADIDERIEAMRAQHVDYEAVEREAADGDQVLIDITGAQNGEALDGLTATDYAYEVGSGAVVAEIDENLRGAKAGATLTFDAEHPEEGEDPLSFTVELKEVRGPVLPDLDDAFASLVSEHETLDALRSALRESLGRQRLLQANTALQNNVGEALAALVTDEVPAAMIDNEVSARVQNLAQRLASQNLDLNRYLQLTGQSPEALVGEYRDPATQAVKIDLALRSICVAEGIEAADADVDEYFANAASAYGIEATQIRENFERAGQMAAVRSDVTKGKALEWVLERVSITDEDGNAVERSALELPEPDSDDQTDDSTAEPADTPEEEQE